jgi:uncharacterized protein (TIGR00290 family)
VIGRSSRVEVDAREQVVLSWSGGKDSSLALAALRADPRGEVVALLTSITRTYDRVSIHGVRRVLVEAQARAAGLPLLEVTLEPACSNAEYEAAFHAALARVRERFPACARVAFGDLFLADVRAYRERLLAGTGFQPLFPLWGLDTGALARRFVADGFRARLACVDTTQLGAEFAGRPFDAALLAALPSSVDPCGERGEFHTFVSHAPVFAEPVPVDVGETVLRDGRFAFCDLLPAGAPSLSLHDQRGTPAGRARRSHHARMPRTRQSAAFAALRPVAGVEELQVVGAVHDRVLDQLEILTSARSVWLHPDVVHRIGRQREFAAADTEFVLAHMARTILRPRWVGRDHRAARAEHVHLVGEERDTDGTPDARHLCVTVKLVEGQRSLSGLDEVWVSSAFPMGARSLTRLERRGRLVPVAWAEDD